MVAISSPEHSPSYCDKNERFSAFRPVGRHVTATPDSTKTDDKLSCDDDENDEINITDETNDDHSISSIGALLNKKVAIMLL
jgi:hypothetical protein